jgi:hypothetical protein
MAKQRLPRLSYAVWSDGEPFTFTPEDWARCEAALGVTLDDGRRAAILDAVGAYLGDVGKEASAPLASDEAKWLERLRNVAGGLHALVDVAKVIGSAERSALGEIQAALNGIMAEPPAFELATLPAWLNAAIDKVQSRRAFEAETGLTGFDHGDAWRILVRRLATIVADCGVKITLRVNDEAKRPGKLERRTTPFAKFFAELQGRFPPAAQQPHSSMITLSKALQRARAPQYEGESPPAPPMMTAKEWRETRRKQ